MPFAGFDGWDDCMQTMTEEEGHDQQSAENICGALQAENKADNGNVAELREALADGAGLIADVGVDLVSGVDVPAIDSKWVAMKAEDDAHDWQAQVPILKADGEDKRISYAAAMIPREPDKEGDVAPTPTVEKAAHDFLKSDGGIDTDHSLIDGEGHPVESWVLKEERTFDLPNDGGTETYPEGTWMLGIEWGKDAWERIKAGELTGLSIYGMAEHVPLERAALPTAKSMTLADGVVAVEWDESDWDLLQRRLDAAETDATGDKDKGQVQESEGMGDESATETEGDDDVTIDAVAASVDDLADTVSAMKEAVETEKQGEQEAAATIAEAYDDVAPGDVLDLVEMAASRGLEDVKEAVESAKADDEDDDEEEDDDEMEASAEKRADDANIEKGGNGTTTAAKGIEDDDEPTAGVPSYAAAAEQNQGDS